MEAPFSTGQRLHPDQLHSWEYVGLSGMPGRDKHSVRRFKKGDWVLEMHAHKDPRAVSRVVSIRTIAEDADLWAETRTRLMRHKQQPS
jgi:hypothetical protein